MFNPIKIASRLFIGFFILISLKSFAQVNIYDQLWSNPQVNERIEKNIEAYRKGDAVIEIVAKKGTPVPNVK